MIALRHVMPQRARGSALKSLIIGCAALSLSACAGTKVSSLPPSGGSSAAENPVRPDAPNIAPVKPFRSPVAQPSQPVPPAPDLVKAVPVGGPPDSVQPRGAFQPDPNVFAPTAEGPAPVPFALPQPTAPYAPPPDLAAQPPVKRYRFGSIPGWFEGDHAPVLASLRSAVSRYLAEAAIGGQSAITRQEPQTIKLGRFSSDGLNRCQSTAGAKIKRRYTRPISNLNFGDLGHEAGRINFRSTENLLNCRRVFRSSNARRFNRGRLRVAG